MPLGIAAMDEKAWIARKPSPISLPGWLRGPGWQGSSVHCLLDIGGRSDYSSFQHMGLVIQDSGKSYCRKWVSENIGDTFPAQLFSLNLGTVVKSNYEPLRLSSNRLVELQLCMKSDNGLNQLLFTLGCKSIQIRSTPVFREKALMRLAI